MPYSNTDRIRQVEEIVKLYLRDSYKKRLSSKKIEYFLLDKKKKELYKLLYLNN